MAKTWHKPAWLIEGLLKQIYMKSTESVLIYSFAHGFAPDGLENALDVNATAEYASNRLWNLRKLFGLSCKRKIV